MKFSTLITILFLSIIMVACSGKKKDKTIPTAAPVPEVVTPLTPAPDPIEKPIPNPKPVTPTDYNGTMVNLNRSLSPGQGTIRISGADATRLYHAMAIMPSEVVGKIGQNISCDLSSCLMNIDYFLGIVNSNPMPGTKGSARRIIFAYHGANLSLSNLLRSTATLRFSGRDAEVLYKEMKVSETTSRTATNYSLLKEGDHISCELSPGHEENTESKYACSVRFKYRSGSVIRN